MSTLKSIWAVLAGMLVNVVLSLGTDTALETAGIFTPPSEGFFTTWMMALALAYRLLFTYLGGWATARLAPQNPQRHVRILGIIGTILCIIGVFVAWDLSAHWYPIALALTAYPATVLGGKKGIKN